MHREMVKLFPEEILAMNVGAFLEKYECGYDEALIRESHHAPREPEKDGSIPLQSKADKNVFHSPSKKQKPRKIIKKPIV